MEIPFLNLKAQYSSIRDEITEAIQEVIDRTAFAGGPCVSRFEKEFADYCQTRDTVAVNSGTTALWMALMGLGIKAGDEVITVPNTFIATAEAISFCGAKPVFVDVDEKTYTMNPDLLETAISNKTKAIIPVHLYGQMADMDPILEIAKSHGIHVIEDASQAHGAEYHGKRAGSIADAGCFSFYPGKNLGAYGEAGAIVTNNPQLADWMRMFRDHGQAKKYYHSIIGWNSRMDGLQAAVLSVKLRHIEEWTEARRKNAALYNQLLSGNDDIILPVEAGYARHVYHIYAIRVCERDTFIQSLQTVGISCGIHYPVPIHLQKAYECLGLGEGSFPVAEHCASIQVSLPMYAELTERDIEHVTGNIASLQHQGLSLQYG